MWVSKLLCAVILWLRPKKDSVRNRKGLAFGEMKRISPNRQYEQHICCSQTFSGWQKELEKTMKSSWPLIFLQTECSLFSLCFKIKTNARSCTKCLDKDTTKARNTAPFVCGKVWLYFRRQSGESCSKHALRVENPAALTDYFCVYILLCVSGMPCNCSRRLSQAYMFSVPMTTRTCLRHSYFV